MMRVLMIGHRPGDDAATTLALAAAAALNGLGGDGRRLIEVERLPSVVQIATEAGLRRETARSELDVLREEGAVAFKSDGAGRSLHVEVNPDALRDRWANYRQRCRFPEPLRRLDLRPNVVLIAGLVLGQRGRSGHCALGRRFLVERTGWSLDVVRRSLRGAVTSKAIKRWMVGDQLYLAAGEGLAHPNEEEGDLSDSAPPYLSEIAPPTCPETHPNLSDSAPEPVRFRTTPSGNPDTRIQPSGGDRAAPEVETGPEQQQQSQNQKPTNSGTVRRLQLVPDVTTTPTTTATTTATTTPTTKPTTPEQVREVVENWRIENKRLDVLNPADPMHAVAVVLLLERLGWNQPADLNEGPARRRDARTSALRKAMLADARRVIAWAGTADTLATWILRAIAEHGPNNVCAYVRKASSAGDPGTLLHSAKKNTTGRAAETWRDYSPATEQALEGEHMVDVQRLVAGGAAMRDADLTDEERVRLRVKLASILANKDFKPERRDKSARAVLLRLVGPSPKDAELEAAVAGICTLAEARRLIA